MTVTSGNALNVFSYPFVVGQGVFLEDEGTRLSVDLGATLDPRSIEIGEGALLDVPLNGFVDSFYVTNEGEIRGAGSTIDVVVLKNEGLIRGNGGLLTFTSSSIDDPFDLDGTGAGTQLQALVGDLDFQGDITDPVIAYIEVGPGHFDQLCQWLGAATVLQPRSCAHLDRRSAGGPNRRPQHARRARLGGPDRSLHGRREPH